jgi:hypothetical protein
MMDLEGLKLIRVAKNIPYQNWREIEPLMKQTNDGHTKEVLRRLMYVKRNRELNHGN